MEHNIKSIPRLIAKLTYMKKMLLWLGVAVAFAGCKKEEQAGVDPFAVNDYMPGTTGSYWIYQEYRGDTLGNFTAYGTDSAYITADTTIGGVRYVSFYGLPLMDIGAFKDSAQQFFSPDGELLLADPEQTGVLLRDTIHLSSSEKIVTETFMEKDVAINCPAGNFTAQQCKMRIAYSDVFAVNNRTYIAHSYVKNVGMVLHHAFYSTNPNMVYECRLLRYHIQQ
jgi:hypothetical protein